VPVDYTNPHQQSFDAAKEELGQLEEEDRTLTERLAWVTRRKQQLQDYLKVLAPLLEEDPRKQLAEAGITEICRAVLERTPRWMTAQEVREQLTKMGISLAGYTNQMAVLHSILKRVGLSRTDAKGNMEYARRPVAPTPRSTLKDLGMLTQTPRLQVPQLDDLRPVPDPDAIGPPQSVQGLEQSKRKK